MVVGLPKDFAIATDSRMAISGTTPNADPKFEHIFATSNVLPAFSM